MDYPEPEDKLDQELASLREKAQKLPPQLLDRDLAEVSIEIQFLEAQIRADPDSYTADQLARAHTKIARFKKRAEILKTELDRKNPPKGFE